MRPTLPSQPRHHLLHPLLADVGVNLGGGDALVAQQGFDVHQLGPVALANTNSPLARSFKICAVSYSFYVATLTGLLHKPNTSHLKEES